MKLGMVGLGRMGANMTRRLMRGGHEVVVSDLSADNMKQIASEGAIPSSSLDDFVGKLGKPRIAWLMVPTGSATEQTVTALGERMQPDDVLIIYTDGVTEANDAKADEFGEDRLEQLVRRNLSTTPTQLLGAIQRAVQEFSFGEQFDDLTLVVARVR